MTQDKKQTLIDLAKRVKTNIDEQRRMLAQNATEAQNLFPVMIETIAEKWELSKDYMGEFEDCIVLTDVLHDYEVTTHDNPTLWENMSYDSMAYNKESGSVFLFVAEDEDKDMCYLDDCTPEFICNLYEEIALIFIFQLNKTK